jgi:hypothetical protein
LGAAKELKEETDVIISGYNVEGVLNELKE